MYMPITNLDLCRSRSVDIDLTHYSAVIKISMFCFHCNVHEK
jgi:hypothetical protein